jgi:zinc/manganese transport system substrate-binding protein
MTRILITAGAAAASLAFAAPAFAGLNIFACEPEWGALAQELGGNHVDVYVATTGGQDPHQIQARPSLIAKARRADMSVCTGAELEVGWLPQIRQQSGNAKIQVGAPGVFEATSVVNLLERPALLDRAQGDIHAAGNPHIQTDPRNILPVAEALSARFAAADAADAADYAAKLADFKKRWQAALQRWTAEGAPLKGKPVVVQHNSWIYLESWLGLERVAVLEPKPGVPASAGYLAEVLTTLQSHPARIVINAAYEDDRPSRFIAERAGLKEVTLPYTVGGTPAATDLFKLYDETLRLLLQAAGA